MATTFPSASVSETARARLHSWLDREIRDLPMRGDHVTPWGALVMEVMSQQTPLSRVEPVWKKWMAQWPTPAALAAADPADILVAWDRLGYPSRALRLRECAAAITARPGGEVPADLEELLALPGIGLYTASALASFIFHQRVPVLDTNVRRVIHRLIVGAGSPSSTSPTKKEVAHATALLPTDGAECARWNLALMEFGALVCTSRSPKCGQCPVRQWCAWDSAGQPEGAARRTQAWAGTDRQARGRIMAALRQAYQKALRGSESADGVPIDEGGAGPRSAVGESAAGTSVASAPPGITHEEALAAGRLPGAEASQAERALEALARDGLIIVHPDGMVTLPGT
ncbi:MAG: A/G-specific adenine glycosylase [Actinomycetaceae bacterium]|nr:A/G-specific adenine glycosylase [Actinomycetaceae bacterium]